jgi:hypothetical protein
MYYPYLRGKRFELYSINECIDIIGEKTGIVPIIEPITVPKDEKSDLHKCLQLIQNNSKSAILIINPKVGNAKNAENVDIFIKIAQLFDKINIALIVDKELNVDVVEKIISSSKNLYLIHNSEASDKSAIEEIARYENLVAHICEADKKSIVRNYNMFKPPQKYIILSDPFPKEDRNADYLDNSEEIFTRQHQYYNEDGYVGFSDFATVGGEYSDLGFMPRVVAIHFTYKMDNDFGIWLRHFVSIERSQTTADIAGKYGEARKKLFEFIEEKKLSNPAIKKWTEGHDEDRYEGLGKVKQYSLMNHFYVVKSAMDAIRGV